MSVASSPSCSPTQSLPVASVDITDNRSNITERRLSSKSNARSLSTRGFSCLRATSSAVVHQSNDFEARQEQLTCTTGVSCERNQKLQSGPSNTTNPVVFVESNGDEVWDSRFDDCRIFPSKLVVELGEKVDYSTLRIGGVRTPKFKSQSVRDGCSSANRDGN